jgi:hypothetical protein
MVRFDKEKFAAYLDAHISPRQFGEGNVRSMFASLWQLQG